MVGYNNNSENNKECCWEKGSILRNEYRKYKSGNST